MKQNHHVQDIMGFCRQHWPESDSLIHHYILHLHRLSQVETQRAEPVMASFGLSMTEFDVLATLRRSARPYVLSPTDLQRSTLLSSGGQTKVLYQLERRGLVLRSVDPQDKRSKLVHLNRKGKTVIEQAMAATLDGLSAGVAQAGLSAPELEQLITLLGKLLAHLEAGPTSDLPPE